MPRPRSFECEECSEFKDITYGCLNPLCWEFKGRPPVLDRAPTAEERKSRLTVVTVGDIAAKRKAARAWARASRARAQAEYIAGCIRHKRKLPQHWRRSNTGKMLAALGLKPAPRPIP